MDPRELLRFKKELACAEENLKCQEARAVQTEGNIQFWKARVCELELIVHGHLPVVCESCGG